ncbi:MAG: hypothetical protein OEV42_16130 [Deltaproteobacteria bacterium]|nr:hypothetical protein [Deltaproteobacteria bacterium]
MKIILKALIILVFFAGMPEAAEINKENWINHPEIIKVRNLYNEIESAIKSKSYKAESQNCELYGGSFVILGTIYRDKNSKVRKYVLEGGSGDSAGEAWYYYDEHGVPRFSFLQRRAANGTELEKRIYFDEKGRHIYTDTKLKGPGWPGGFSDSMPEPLEDFANLCKG